MTTLPEQSERIVIAALFYTPSLCADLLDRIERSPFTPGWRCALLAPCCDAIRSDGSVNVDSVMHAAAAQCNMSAHEIGVRIVKTYEWSSFIHDKGTLVNCLDYIDDHKREIDKARSLEILAKQLGGNGVDLNDARLVIDQLIEDGACNRDKLQTLTDTLATDPSEEPVEILQTGLTWFDQALPNGGFQRGDKVVFSAPPGAGKTALALQLALNILDHNDDADVLWCLGEMTTKSLRNRALQCVSGLNMEILRRGWQQLDHVQESKKREAIGLLKSMGKRFHFLPAPLTPKNIENAIVSTKADFVAVDYLQLVRPDGGDRNSRREEVDAVVREFMRISQKHSPVLFLISDMAKGAEHGRDIFSAFKESSEIPFAADLAYVAEIQDDKDAQGDWPEPLEMQLRCLKARHGRSTNIRVQFSRNTQQFAGSTVFA